MLGNGSLRFYTVSTQIYKQIIVDNWRPQNRAELSYAHDSCHTPMTAVVRQTSYTHDSCRTPTTADIIAGVRQPLWACGSCLCRRQLSYTYDVVVVSIIGCYKHNGLKITHTAKIGANLVWYMTYTKIYHLFWYF